MTRLSTATLDRAKAAKPAARPEGTGIVHFGPGAFHRAHQADYIDRLIATDPRWGVALVSLRSGRTVADLAEQDGLYTLAIRDAEPSLRILGCHTHLLGPGDAASTRALLAAPETRLVTTTITEKGYCLGPDGTLDLSHPDIAADLAGEGAPVSAIGWIVAGLADRRAAGLEPFVVMPCDNMADNGAKMRAALLAFAAERDPALADWLASELRVPATMVDSITPASDPTFLADVAEQIGLEDRAAVQREAFVQWVVEDVGAIGPDLASVGVEVTRDVAGFERAKLRILNGSHSTLAYLGLLRGHVSVAEAMGDGELARFVEAMIVEEIAPMLPAVPGLDLDRYRAAVLQRFRNPVIVHALAQIAYDGSQKLPYRLYDTILANRAAGRMPRRALGAVAGWLAFAVARARSGTLIVDPLGEELARLGASGDAAAVMAGFTADPRLCPPALTGDAAAVETIAGALAALLADPHRLPA
ncbi:MAG TPA: mannitol dehydrogenase family protein [Sphingomonas sp.]|nr:mannitol dehydrogenase family protein [Sphingomonas sp.]